MEGANDPAQQATVTELDWIWIASSLAGQGITSSNKRGNSPTGAVEDDESSSSRWKWSDIRLVDTVLLDDSGDVKSWVFTAKTGHVTRKKKSMDKDKIVERFARFALANSSNTEGYVALIERRDHCGHKNKGRVRTVLNKSALEKALIGSDKMPPELLGATLQCYLRPQKGSNSFLRARYRAQDQSFSLAKVFPLYNVSHFEEEGDVESFASSVDECPLSDDGDPEAARMRRETEAVMTSLVTYLEARLPEGTVTTTIHECDADFVVDDNGELWLISLPSVAVAPAADSVIRNTAPILSASSCLSPSDIKQYPSRSLETAGKKQCTRVSMPPLRTSAAEVAPLYGDGTPLGTARRQSRNSSACSATIEAGEHVGTAERDEMALQGPVALPEIPTMLGARSTPGEHNKFGGPRGKAAPIIEKNNGVYFANVHSSALRGLCCWREVSRSTSCCGHLSPYGQVSCAEMVFLCSTCSTELPPDIRIKNSADS